MKTITLNTILAENTGLSVKDTKTVFIKDGGVIYYPTIDAEGHVHLAHKSFTKQSVLDARKARKDAKAEAKAQKDAEKAQVKAQAALAKAQARVAELQAKASASPAVAESTVTVVGSSAV